jgi:hypothetical protein
MRVPYTRFVSEFKERRAVTSSVESGNTSLYRPRRSSTLSHEAKLGPEPIIPPQFSEDSEDDSEDDEEEEFEADEPLQMPVRHPLLEEPTIPVRKISDRSPPVPPTLQLRRSSASSGGAAPRIAPTSGLSATLANNNASQFTQLIQPGPSAAAPPYLSTTSAVVTDLPYAPLTVGSSSSARIRLTQLQQGQLSPDELPQTTSNFGDTASPIEERSSTKAASLENTRYELSPEAHNMIRRLSNGPPGSLRRPSSPSPSMPNGWAARPDRMTRTMARQVIYRDLEQEASEQQYGMYSPMIIRPDSRTDYFNPSMNDPISPQYEDERLNSYLRQLPAEIRRLNNELVNAKTFSDPMTDALKRLAQRKGAASPISQVVHGQKLGLASSWFQRSSPERRDSPGDLPLRKHSLPTHLSGNSSHSDSQRSETHRVEENVFSGENESKLREVKRQLWNSWPEKSDAKEPDETEGEERSTTEHETLSTTGTSMSPVETRDSTSRPISPAEKRITFGSGLRRTWGSALALAGLRSS